MKKQNEAKRHHYIPQFILRNFTDESGQIEYWDKQTKKLEKRNPRSIFMNIDMYRDEENHKDDPTYIEKSLAVFEREIAELIAKTKMLTESKIVLTRLELQTLRIFLTLLSFRSNTRMTQYKNTKFDKSTLNILKEYEPNDNFENLWKKQIDALAKCRSYKDIKESEVIDPIIKSEFLNAIHGMYMTFLESRGGDFLISDIYPTFEIFPMAPNINVYLHALYPLSNTRLLLLNHIMFKDELNELQKVILNPLDLQIEIMKKVSNIQGNMLVAPKHDYATNIIYHRNDKFIYNVQKIYSTDVEYLNALQLNEAKIGVAFKNKSRIIDSITAYNLRDDTKQKYTMLEEILDNQ